MFGFIKFIQSLIDKLKGNKRAWFTSIFVISVAGIALSIFFLMTITDSASEDVYNSQANEYKHRYNNFSINQLDEFRKMSVLLFENNEFVDLVLQDNIDQITSSVDGYNIALEEAGFQGLEIKYFSARNSILTNLVSSIIQSRNLVYGLNIMSDGVYYVYLQPVIIENQLTGVLQIRSNLHDMYLNFLNMDQEFGFLLDKNLIVNVALAHREGRYEEFASSHLFNNETFNNTFLRQLASLSQPELREFFDKGYVVTDNYYIAYDDTVDVNGVNIGLVVFGERIDKEGGFISVTSKITNQVVMVALGLIVSVLLFMF